MRKILISGAGGDVARNLVEIFRKKYYIVTTSSIIKNYIYSNKNYLSPSINLKKKYINFLAKIIKNESIKYFFPCIDGEIPLIAKNIKKFNCKVFVEKYRKVKLCHDKFNTYKYLKQLKINTPKTYVLNKVKISNIKLPVIIKKRIGNASRGIKIIKKKNDIRNLKKNNSFIFQEYLSGNDYTSGSYRDKHGKFHFVVLKRILKNGSTNKCWLINNRGLSNQILNISKKLNFKYLNIQFKVKNNKIYIYELNARISGTTGFQSNIFNAPENFIRENENLRIIKQKKINKLSGARCIKTKLIKKS